MKSSTPPAPGIWSDIMDIDVGAIADPQDKIAECQYFLDLASKELNVQYFRWQISAFLGAAYSFFEITALGAYNALTDSRTGEPVENVEAIEVLKQYVTVGRNIKNSSRIDTGSIHKETKAAVHEITGLLYELRRNNTHHSPLEITAIGTELPEAFHFCIYGKNGVLSKVFCKPALVFCRETMLLIQQVKEEIETC